MLGAVWCMLYGMCCMVYRVCCILYNVMCTSYVVCCVVCVARRISRTVLCISHNAKYMICAVCHMLYAGRMSCVAWCALSISWCMLSVACCMLWVVGLSCMVFVVCCMVPIVCRGLLPHVVWCMVYLACRKLSIVCCMFCVLSSAMCYLLSGEYCIMHVVICTTCMVGFQL